LPSGRINLATIFDFDGDQLETDEDVREAGKAIVNVIGINGIEGDVAFAADLGIGAAGEFEMDGELDGIGHRDFC
jgi:hypothetical protein